MNLETVAEGKGEGPKTRPVEAEEKYNHLLYLCLNKSEGHLKNFIVETIKTIGGEGELVEGSDGNEYRAWDNMKEEDFGNVLFNVIMNLGVIYNQLCSGKEDDTIGTLFETESKKI